VKFYFDQQAIRFRHSTKEFDRLKKASNKDIQEADLLSPVFLVLSYINLLNLRINV
jgi:hypothetical protein